MRFSRSTKQLLVGVAASFLLLCQSAMAAQACEPMPATATERAASEPCHEGVSHSGDTSGHAQQTVCPSEYASASFAKIDVPPVADFPASSVASEWVWAAIPASLNPAAPPARLEPPPHSILHCCLRN